MPTENVKSSAKMSQPASKIYAAIADYKQHHPQFLPKNYFKKLEIESGGIGAGTLFKAEMEVYGSKSSFRMKVSEPNPGQVIAETDVESGTVTSFTVLPITTESATVTIATTWQRPTGLKSWLESSIRKFVMKRIYKEELQLMEKYVATM